MKIVIEAGSMVELRSLLEEMINSTPVAATPNKSTAADIMAKHKAKEKAKEKVETPPDTKSEVESGFSNMENGKAGKGVVDNRVTDEKALEVLTKDLVMAKIKAVKAGTDPDIAKKVKEWLGQKAVAQLADCTNEQFHALCKELSL